MVESVVENEAGKVLEHGYGVAGLRLLSDDKICIGRYLTPGMCLEFWAIGQFVNTLIAMSQVKIEQFIFYYLVKYE